ncbi:MAG: hypothetical protein JWM68_5563 [Verrucomicrobiales bacterium]|nr:hypothetical protein [Verrucomicrobiales bacterium]
MSQLISAACKAATFSCSPRRPPVSALQTEGFTNEILHLGRRSPTRFSLGYHIAGFQPEEMGNASFPKTIPLETLKNR